MGTRWLNAEQQRAWRAYLLGSARLTERLEHDLRRLGLSMPEYEILVRLSEAPDRTLRMAQLAASVHQSRSRLTHTITRMEEAGHVTRFTCEADKRGVFARLTDQGYAQLVEAAPVHVAGVRENLVDLVDPEDLEALGRVFTAVITHTGGPSPSPPPPRQPEKGGVVGADIGSRH